MCTIYGMILSDESIRRLQSFKTWFVHTAVMITVRRPRPLNVQVQPE